MVTKTSSDSDFRTDTRLQTGDGDMLIEVKRTSTAIDLRGVLPSLAYALKDEPSTSQAICVLQETRLTQDRLREELASSVRP